MTRRIIALLIALLMGIGMLACGDAEQGGKDTTPSAGGDTTAPEATGPKSGVPAGTNFGDQAVRILNATYWDRYQYLLNSPETTGDTVSDAVYNRNLAVEARLGIKLEITNGIERTTTQNDATNTLRKNVNSGDQDYDIFQSVQAYSTTYATEGLITDIQDSDYISFDEAWWSTQWMEKAHLGTDKRYLVTGDISALHTMNLTVTFCNKNMLEDYYGDGDMIYKDVLNGKWTLDRMYELSSGIYKDLNGDNKKDIEDTVGFAANTAGAIQNCMFICAGGRTTYYDENGEVQVIGIEERETNIVEKLYRLTWDNPGFLDSKGIDSEQKLPLEFAKGNIAFMSNYLYTADYLRDMEDSYAIIPCPKLDESAESYISLIHDQTPVYCLPAVTSTKDISCATLEELAFEGYMNMLPQYYEVALKNKYMRDNQDDSMKVMDMIRDAAISEPGVVLKLDMYYAGRYCIQNGNTNYASQHATAFEASKAKLETVKDFYFD